MTTISESEINFIIFFIFIFDCLTVSLNSGLIIIPAELEPFSGRIFVVFFFSNRSYFLPINCHTYCHLRIMKSTLTFDFDLTLRELGDDRKHLRHVDFGIRADANKSHSAVGNWQPNRKWKVKRNPTATQMTLTAAAAKPGLIKSGTLSACD